MRPLRPSILLPRLAWLAAVLALPACSDAPEAPSPAQAPPNIILVMADDLGYGDLGVYGQARMRTPHLDRMATEGMLFSQFYAGSTVCAPSRSTLMTGQHTGHTTVRNNVGWQPRGDVPLRPADTTLAEVLHGAGYTTGAFGKWALGLESSTGAPHLQGFDAFMGYVDQSEAHDYYVPRLQTIADGVTTSVAVDSAAYSHDLIMGAALQFIRDHRDTPFFAYLPVTLPHADLVVPDDGLAPYLDAEGNSLFREPVPGNEDDAPMPHANLAGMISRLDRDMGRLLALLRELGLERRTIVLFTSDNGPHAEGGSNPDYFDRNGPLRGIKRDLYEGGIRVPMIAWGPGTIPAGTESHQPWALWDLLPTLAEFAGAAPPVAIDGTSFVPTLTRQGEQPQPQVLYWEFYHPNSTTLRQALRQGPWKAVRFTSADAAPTLEIYNLVDDPGENRDLASEYPDRADALNRLIDAAHTPSDLPDFRYAP